MLTLEHVGHVDDEFWDRFGPGAVGLGWEGALLGLAGHLGSPGVPKPADSEAWAVSDEGRAFMVRSARARGATAHIAAGADPEAARRRRPGRRPSTRVGNPPTRRGGPRGGGVSARRSARKATFMSRNGMKVAFPTPPPSPPPP